MNNCIKPLLSSHVESRETRILPFLAFLPARGGLMTPFSSVHPKKSIFIGERLVLKSIFFSIWMKTGSDSTKLSSFCLPTLNADVMSGCVWLSWDEKVEVEGACRKGEGTVPAHGV